jgi:hypothetical protein
VPAQCELAKRVVDVNTQIAAREECKKRLLEERGINYGDTKIPRASLSLSFLLVPLYKWSRYAAGFIFTLFFVF